jgi:hypothetical protein
MALVNSAIDAVVAMVSGLRVSPREQEDSMPKAVQRSVTFAPVCEVIPEQLESEEWCPLIDVEAMAAEAAAEYARQGHSA